MPWAPNVTIPDQLSKASPALAAFDGGLHMVHLGDGSNRIWHSVFDGAAWSPNVAIPSQASKASPALAAFDGALHMVHLGDGSNRIWHSVFDGSAWSPNVAIPDQSSKAPPALAAVGRELHMVHLGEQSNALWHSVFDGSSWSPNVRIPDQLAKAAPALGAFEDALHMVHLGDSSNRLWHSQFDGAKWSPNEQIPNQLSKASPALAAFVDVCGNARLHMLHLGDSSNRIWQAEFEFSFRPNLYIVGQLSRAAVALAAFDGLLHVVHLGDDSNRLWHARYDGLSHRVPLHLKVLEQPEDPSLEEMLVEMSSVYAGVDFRVEVDVPQPLDLPALEIVDVGPCTLGSTTSDQDELFSHRDGVGHDETTAYFIHATVPGSNGCASHPADFPACVVTQSASRWTLGHEVGHVLGLVHVDDSHNLMFGGGTDNITDPPPELTPSQVNTMTQSPFVRRCSVTLPVVLAALAPDEPEYGRLARELGPAALPHLLELVRGPEAAPAARAASLAAAIGGVEAAPALEAAATRPDAGVRAVAAGGAPQLPPERAEPLLEGLLDDSHPAVVRLAVVALRRLAPSAGTRAKAEAIAASHPDAIVRRAAQGTLDAWG